MTKNRSKALLASRVFNSFSRFLQNSDRLCDARILCSSFTRNRKLPLDCLLPFLIFRTGKTISEEIDFFFQNCSDPPSPQAMVKRESILNYDVCQEISEEQCRQFYDSGLLTRTCKDYQIIAIDGSKVILTPSPALDQVFGGSLNQYIPTKEEILTPVAHHSAAYDPGFSIILLLPLERFHTVSPIVIMNQTMGKVVFSNLAGLLQAVAVEELDDEAYNPNLRKIIQNLHSS